MNHRWTLTSALALAAVIGTGITAAPVALDSDLTPMPNAALAQTSGSDDGSGNSNGTSGEAGVQDDSAAGDTIDDSSADNVVESESENPGGAVSRSTATAAPIPDTTADNVYEILGTTQEDAAAASPETGATASSGPLESYQSEVERGNLDAATTALAEIAEEPITQDMVTEVNAELGVETTLSAQQIAETAAQKQDSVN